MDRGGFLSSDERAYLEALVRRPSERHEIARRANAVLRALTSRGASERQLTVASFGEERPVAEGHDDRSETA